MEKFLTQEVKAHLVELTNRFSSLEEFSINSLEDVTRQYLEEKNIKFKLLAQPIRICITGQTASPGLFETMAVLGKDRTLNRLNRALRLV